MMYAGSVIDAFTRATAPESSATLGSSCTAASAAPRQNPAATRHSSRQASWRSVRLSVHPVASARREIRHLRVARHQDERGRHREPRDRPPGTDRVVERQVQGQQQPGDTGDHRDLWVLEALARDHARADERDGRDEPGRWSETQPVRERDHPDAEDQQMERGDQHHRAPRIETDERQLQRVEQPDLGVGQVGHPSEDGGIPLGDSPGEERTERDGFVGRRVRVRVEALDDAARSQERPRHEREEEGRTEQLEPTRPPEVAQRMWRDHTMVGVASGRRARG